MSATLVATRTCPRCARRGAGASLPLEPMDLSGVEVDFCSACNGLWLDAGEVSRVLGVKLAIEARALAPDEVLACPSCATEGRRPALAGLRVPTTGVLDVDTGCGGGIDIDTCSACSGVWLDAGELQALRREARRQESGACGVDVVTSADGGAPPPPDSPPAAPTGLAAAAGAAAGAAASILAPGGAATPSAGRPARPRRAGPPEVLFGSLIALVALGFFLHAASGLKAGRATLGWSAAEGVIQQARIDQRTTTEAAGSNGRRRTRTQYRQRVTYSYEVGGRTFQSHRITAQRRGWRNVRPSRQYHVGERVRVYHDPTDPTLAVLERGTTASGWLQLLLAAAACVYGCMVVLGRAPLPEVRAG